MPQSKQQTWKDLTRELAAQADEDRAVVLRRFFKTAAGEYGEGDCFLGITVPAQRKTALRYTHLPFKDIRQLLKSPIHEERSCALEILVWQYQHAEPKRQEEIFSFYLKNTKGVNNWDLVDCSAPYIVGAHLLNRPQTILDELATSKNIWQRRIAIVATLKLIKHGELEPTFRIAQQLLSDKHDLIHKAVGWALREAGKISEPYLVRFLRKHYTALPRTTLRYAIERFPPERRKRMLSGDFVK